MSNIRSIKAQIAAVRDEIMAEAEAKITAQTQALTVALEDACLTVYRETGKVAAVQREYGTKDFRTVKEILTRAEQRAAYLTPAATPPAERYKIEAQGERADGSPLYKVTDAETGDSVTVAIPPTGVPVTSGQIEPQWKLPVDERPMGLYHSLRDETSDARAALDRYRSVTESD